MWAGSLSPGQNSTRPLGFPPPHTSSGAFGSSLIFLLWWETEGQPCPRHKRLPRTPGSGMSSGRTEFLTVHLSDGGPSNAACDLALRSQQ